MDTTPPAFQLSEPSVPSSPTFSPTHRSTRLQTDAGASLHLQSRSPHPYHRHDYEILQQKQYANGDRDDNTPLRHRYAGILESLTMSDSGTEADDEHFLKGLPAPRGKVHKGLRGMSRISEGVSGDSTPAVVPGTPLLEAQSGDVKRERGLEEKERRLEWRKRRKVVVRRLAELGVVGALVVVVVTNERVNLTVIIWARELMYYGGIYLALLLAYPARVLFWTFRNPRCTIGMKSLVIPTDFDPAPILYPQIITLLAALLISTNDPTLLIPNIVLAAATLPEDLIPLVYEGNSLFSTSSVHWLLTLLPVAGINMNGQSETGEIISMLYPLYRALLGVLYSLTTTSLLPTELELLSVAMLNVLLFAESPQIKILRALLWVGGFSVLVFTGSTILKGIALARVPKWRFRRLTPRSRPISLIRPLQLLWNPLKLKHELIGPSIAKSSILGISEVSDSSVDDWEVGARSSIEKVNKKVTNAKQSSHRRQKRTMSASLRPLLKLTPEQATARKWVYAAYVYVCIAILIVGPVRGVLSWDALGYEAIGWALGYLFGDIGQFRWQVVSHGLERWIILPPRVDMMNAADKAICCGSGWVQHIRFAFIGVANTRLLIAAYWLLILIVGLLVVFRLSAIYEVDTRRKVFHFMMVGMMLPSIFVDPAFCAMALSFALAVFLLLDLLRASQLPPLSKPIATFLAPYVDGRDFQGPVVISHIFLLIGCAIPLWLTLASLPRTPGSSGWELPVRDLSMVSGVVCVGLGDAAASLIGRRYGRNKWYWGGEKSLEGSVAFAVAVTVGLMGASAWVRFGGWPVEKPMGVVRSVVHAVGCGSLASLTEAVLTGGNDNVIVPVVLWICGRSVGV